ncbi:hypothetical protein WMY93_000770 [Mugilogobius chulae]|uniref:EGF-like domain-containing protein n=1 Tax=Mugilogobius chulae TaxID=88201 RepID=A0AAW0QAV9_9GOBI
MAEEFPNDSPPDLKELEAKVGRKTPESLLMWMKDDAEETWRGDVDNNLFNDDMSAKINYLRQEMRWLRSTDVRILRQLLVVHEGIEAMRWLAEERGASISQSSSLTGSLNSLITVDEYGLSRSRYRDSLTSQQDVMEDTEEDSLHTAEILPLVFSIQKFETSPLPKSEQESQLSDRSDPNPVRRALLRSSRISKREEKSSNNLSKNENEESKGEIELLNFETERTNRDLSHMTGQEEERYNISRRCTEVLSPRANCCGRWMFTVTKNNNFHCRPYNVSIYIRWKAPPVINPVGTVFPKDTLWNPPLTLSLPVPETLQSSTTFNLSSPAAGDWYIAAHLPENDGRIEQKGFPSCSYFFQPQLSVRKAVDTPLLEQGNVLQQTTGPDQAARLKLYVPEFSSSVSVWLTNCSSEDPRSDNCSVVLRIGSRALLVEPLTVNCSGSHCSATLPSPPWDMWLQVVVETNHSNHTVTFSIVSSYTVSCKPKNVGLAVGDDFSRLRGNSGPSNSTSTKNSSEPSLPAQFSNTSSSLALVHGSSCVENIPILSEELDVLSVRYTPTNGASINVTSAHPTLLSYPLHTATTGGTFNLQLSLNSTNATLGNGSSVVACLSPWAPVLQLNHSVSCQTALFNGYSARVNTSVPKAVIRLPYPQSATWYLTLQLTCNGTDCGNASVVSVIPEVFVSACVEDCGTYGECRLIRSFTYLYAACSCKAGWSGWGCTDSSKALSFSRQLIAALMLTISNLFFIPAIVVAVKRYYITEASVYLFTMFFSTFYHACDQPGVTVMCIMDYDALQYCDFLGSVCSIWVTILCMARIKDTFKYALFMLGALLLALSMQLDRKGLWNMLGPVLCALLILIAAWVYRGVKRHHCYPPSWRRWVFFLLPGALCALIAVSVFVFAQTEDNYYYTHSMWHVLVAGCVVFLLPPKEKHREAFGWTQGFSWTWSWRPRVCGYTLCESGRDELYTVT